MVTHTKVLALISALVLALTAGARATPAADEENAAFQGVWRTVQVVVPGPEGRTLKPGSTLAIFHGRHYSRVEVHSDGPRPPLTDPAAASADQLRAVWGPFVGEAGTFELSGKDVITMQATVAKNPAVMAQGAVSVYTYRRDGSTLTLTQVRTPAGPAPDAITVTLARVE
jgi:hypothetical protein